MNRFLTTLFWLFMTIGFIVLVIKVNRYKKLIVQGAGTDSLMILKENSSLLQNRILLQTEVSQTYKIFDTLTIQTVDRKIGNLTDIMTQPKCLVFRFAPQNHCLSCIESALGYLKQEVDERKITAQIIFLVSDISDNEMVVWSNRLGVQIPIFKVDADQLPVEIERHNLPYFFILDKSGNASNIFFVEYELKKLSSYYLDYELNILNANSTIKKID